MEDEGTNADTKQHYLRVASALRDRLQNGEARTGDEASALMEVLEIAAKEFRIEREDQGRGEVKRVCQHSCGYHAEPMNPGLWETLPRELLPLVFGHLPIDTISHMQILNKEWQRTITTDSEFHRVCNEVYPSMICLISKCRFNHFWVRVLDTKRWKWHTYGIVAGRPAVDWRSCKAIMTAACEDGGLLCFVTSWNMESRRKRKRSTLFFHVVNPLTRTSQELPPLFDMRNMELVQIQVDRRTRAFQVFVAARRFRWKRWKMDEVTTQLYDSVTSEWRSLSCDHSLLFHNYNLVYDFAKGRLFNIGYGNLLIPNSASACYKESLFVLKTGSDGPANEELAIESPTVYIEEFRWEATNWVKAKNHRCNPFEHPPKSQFHMTLHACKGFLMVFARLTSRRPFQKKLAWLYNLSTSQWSALDLPRVQAGRRIAMEGIVKTEGGVVHYGDDRYDVDKMCEPQWQ